MPVVYNRGSGSNGRHFHSAILDCELNCRMTKDQDAQIVILRGKDAQIVILRSRGVQKGHEQMCVENIGR